MTVGDRFVESLGKIKRVKSHGRGRVLLQMTEEEVDEVILIQPTKSSKAQDLMVMGDLNGPDICGGGGERTNTAGHRLFNKFLECSGEFFRRWRKLLGVVCSRFDFIK